MKATKIKYEKTFNLGDYSNEVIGVEVELQEGETALEAISAARRYINAYQEKQINRAQWERIVRVPDAFLYKQVEEAKAKLAELDKEEAEEYPF